jgi:hypothetical protein
MHALGRAFRCSPRPQTFKHMFPSLPIMAQQVVETLLPDDPEIERFHRMSGEEKLRVVRLGLLFMTEGTKCVRGWSDAEWEATLRSAEEQAGAEQHRLREKAKAAEAQFSEYVEASKARHDALATEIRDNERRRCNAELEQLREHNETLVSQLDQYRTEAMQMSREYDSRREAKEAELREYYEHKLARLESKTEEMRKEKDAVLERFSQYTHNSSVRGREGEEWVLGRLNMTFPKADIEDTHTQPGRGDFIIRDDGMTMMVEAKNYSRNVQKGEIDKFYRDIDCPSNSDVQCAVFVSLKTGIAGKEDFELEVRGGIPVMFIHSLENNFMNLMLAWKFFKLLTTQEEMDLTDKEVRDGFRNAARSLRRNFAKMRKNADKHHTDTLAAIADQEAEVIGLYGVAGMGF